MVRNLILQRGDWGVLVMLRQGVFTITDIMEFGRK